VRADAIEGRFRPVLILADCVGARIPASQAANDPVDHRLQRGVMYDIWMLAPVDGPHIGSSSHFAPSVRNLSWYEPGGLTRHTSQF